jgi:hypothetical protein
MKRNIQHSIFNIQLRTLARGVLIGRWALNVQCSMFPLAIVFLAATLPLPAQANAIATNTPLTLLPPYGELPPTFWEQHATAVIVVGLGLIILVTLTLSLLFRPKPKIIIPPAAQARQALEQLRQQPEDGAVLSRVSQIVQNYFIAAFRLPPGEFTTAEFSRALAGREELSAELSTAAASFLSDCDDRKFSPATSEPLDAVSRALQLVAQAEQRRAQLHPAAETQGPRA